MPRRKATWALVIFNVLMAIWVIAGAASAGGNATNCGMLDQQSCNVARDVGTGVGVAALIFLWFIGFVVLGIIALVSRPRNRVCPACGTEAKKGVALCRKCGFNFAAAAMSAQGSLQLAQPNSGASVAPGTLSPDGHYTWTGQAWVPTAPRA